MTHQEILAEYPQLKEEDLRAALAYAAELARYGCSEVISEVADEVQAR
jgi:uncharacterized protein (DUF433 family)